MILAMSIVLGIAVIALSFAMIYGSFVLWTEFHNRTAPFVFILAALILFVLYGVVIVRTWVV